MTAATITRGPIACKHCPASTRSALDVARLEGWRLFKGTSVTGKDLDDVVCPACAGTAKPQPDGVEQSWRVRCETCDWDYAEDWEPGDDVLTAVEARELGHEHTCARQIRLAPPSGDKWYKLDDLSKDGTLRPLPEAGSKW